jgi:hypothetical protein
MQLPFERIAVTVPPAEWFHGISRALFEIYRAELEALGLKIFDVPIDAFLLPDVTRVDAIASDLKAFRPELAFGLHKGVCALLCRMPARRGRRANLFLDVLDIPTVCLWDHAPLELADQLLAPHPAGPGDSEGGARRKLGEIWTHPRVMHWSPDTGQTELMQELRFVRPGRVINASLPGVPEFHPQGVTPDRRVGFIGHLYQEPRQYPDPAIEDVARKTLEGWSGEPGLWYVLLDRIAALDGALRTRLALDLDQSYFWHFAHRLILHDAQTALRLKVLGSAGIDVLCYGNLKTDSFEVPRNLIAVPGHIPYGPALAACLARHEIMIDAFNPGSIHGFSHKPMIAFASGGFMLVNRKRDFIHAFGDAGEAVSYQPDSGELAAKIDLFLTKPAYRREVGDAIREIIAERFQLRDVLARVIEAAFDRATESSAADQPETDEETTPVADLLPALQSDAGWTDASTVHIDGTAVLTCAQQWAYAAALRIPDRLKTMRDPCLRIRMAVETGRIGVAALLHTGALIGEQHASANPRPVTMTVELAKPGVCRVIFRSSAPTPCRAVVFEAALCDRSPLDGALAPEGGRAR